jgi:hypothetical protein
MTHSTRINGGTVCVVLVTEREATVQGSGAGSYVMPPFGLGEALGEFIEVAGADERALGGVIAWRQRPVAAGGVAVPDPPLRVLAPEPVKLTIPGIRAATGSHLCFPLLTGAVSRAD